MLRQPQSGNANMDKLESLQKAIRAEGLDGWFFCNFRHRDKLSDEILCIPDHTNSRFWFYAVPGIGEPIKIIHSVEPDALNTLPGSDVYYVSRQDLKKALKPLAGKTWGVHSSEELAAISYLDAGTAAVLKNAGLNLVSAAPLVQRIKSLLDSQGFTSHERASVHLYEIVNTAWNFVRECYNAKKPVYEGDIRNFIKREMEERRLITGHDLIVAAGVNTGNPHYNFTGKGARILEGDIVQFDIWAKEQTPQAIFADISWAGFYGQKTVKDPDSAVNGNLWEEAEKRFDTIVSAREGAISFIREELAAGRKLPGAAVDLKTRGIIISKGYGDGLKHRTGHGIDTEIHGSGVNIDSMEFPDSRLILEGSCFSLEPGIYFSDYGMRTEINLYIRGGAVHVSGSPHDRQFTLLHCGQQD